MLIWPLMVSLLKPKYRRSIMCIGVHSKFISDFDHMSLFHLYSVMKTTINSAFCELFLPKVLARIKHTYRIQAKDFVSHLQKSSAQERKPAQEVCRSVAFYLNVFHPYHFYDATTNTVEDELTGHESFVNKYWLYLQLIGHPFCNIYSGLFHLVLINPAVFK